MTYEHQNIKLILYSHRILAGYYAQDFDDPLSLWTIISQKMNPKKTLFQPCDIYITNEKDTKPYILVHLDNIKLSQTQYIAILSLSMVLISKICLHWKNLLTNSIHSYLQ